MNSIKEAFQLGGYVVTPKLLGVGSYGEVYLGYISETKEKLAVKILNVKNYKEPLKVMKN